MLNSSLSNEYLLLESPHSNFVSWKQGDSGLVSACHYQIGIKVNQPVLAVSTSLELTNNVFFLICTKKKTSHKIQFRRLLIVYMYAMINNNNMSFYKLLEGLGSVSFGWRQPVVPLLPVFTLSKPFTVAVAWYLPHKHSDGRDILMKVSARKQANSRVSQMSSVPFLAVLAVQ